MKNTIKILVTLTILFLSACDSKNKVVEGPFLTMYSKLYFQDSGKLVTGIVKKYHEDAPKVLYSTTTYKNGMKNGSQSIYYENGQLLERGTYIDGKVDGVYEVFWNDGQLRAKGIWSMGMIQNEERFHGFGQLKSKINYLNGLRSGEVITYYSSGTVAIKEYYIDGKLNGIRKDFNEDGSPRTIQEYKDGNAVGKPKCIKGGEFGGCAVNEKLEAYLVR